MDNVVPFPAVRRPGLGPVTGPERSARTIGADPIPPPADGLRRNGLALTKQTAEKPKSGGLHQLALLTGEVKLDRLAAADFSTFRPGFNNRALYGAIVRDLEASFGMKVNHGYGTTTEARPGHISTNEAEIEEMMQVAKTPEERKAIAAFMIAHEYFHAYLKHPEALFGPRPEGFEIKSYSGAGKILELQVDYLAARYLMARGLPTAPIVEMFSLPGKFAASAHYPSGAERAENVKFALDDAFKTELFVNDFVNVIAFLDFLAGADLSK